MRELAHTCGGVKKKKRQQNATSYWWQSTVCEPKRLFPKDGSKIIGHLDACTPGKLK